MTRIWWEPRNKASPTIIENRKRTLWSRKTISSVHKTSTVNRWINQHCRRPYPTTSEEVKNGQNLQQVLEEYIIEDSYSPSPTPNAKTHDVVYHITQLGPTNKSYIDLTGRFPYRSSRDNEYFLIGYHFEANAILATQLKNRHAGTITEAWRVLNEKNLQ